MPTIFDNIEKKFADGVLQHIKNAKRVDYCVGYFNIRGWKTVCSNIDKLDGMEVKENGKTYTRYCRLLVGMTKNPFDTPHVCRHTFCSNMARSGMNPKTLQYIMGHSDISVTLNTYTHVGFEDAQDELKRVVGE